MSIKSELDILLDKVEEDFNISNENISEKMFSPPILFSKYMGLYFKYRKKLISKNKELNQLYSKKWDYYKTEYDIKLTTAKEIEFHILGDEEFATLQEQVQRLEQLVDFFEKVSTKASFLTQDIRNVIDFMKYQQGV